MHVEIANSPGQSLRTLRQFANLTLSETAALAGVSESYLSRVETGEKVAKPRWIGMVVQAIATRLYGADEVS